MKDEELHQRVLEQIAREEYERQLSNLIDMMREFDYRRNGKSTTIDFLAYMIQQFNEYEF